MKSRHGSLRGALSLLCTLAVTQSGCAAYYAMTLPGPKPDERIALGIKRSELESVIAAGPVSQYQEHGGTSARYEYEDGPHEGSKGRALLYVAGDFFTVCLAEVIFFPIELAVKKSTERIALAHYDADNVLVSWRVTKASGEVLVDLAPEAPAAPAPPAEPAAPGEPEKPNPSAPAT